MKNTYKGLFLCKMLFLILTLYSFTVKDGITAPIQLTISEGLTNPLGFYDSKPSFSWKLPVGVTSQSAYTIVVASSPKLLPNNPDLWNSGKVNADQSLNVNYNGKKLDSRQKVYWQVKYWDDKGAESKWSEMAHFELGLLQNSDWKANWISVPPTELNEISGKNSVLFRPQYLRKQINIHSNIKKARLYITAKGVFEAYINGAKIGTDVMTPGWTPFDKSISTLTYDVTDMLMKGENVLSAILAEGWHSGRIHLRRAATKEDVPYLLCQLEIETNKGKQIIVTDKSWKVSLKGPIRESNIYDGEIYDANFNLGKWQFNGYDDSNWLQVVEQKPAETVLLLPKRYQTVKDKETISVKTLTEPVAGKPIFNFGQNNVGVPLIKVPMKKGDTLTVRFAEMLNTDGTMYTGNYRGAKSTDYYIAAKDGLIEWRPQFTFHGYQYIELSGFDPKAKPQKDWVTAIVQYSDFKLNGTFASSHEKLNQLQSNISWGLKGNFFDIPTDCPQRDERLGWTGDAQVIAPTAIYNADMYAFWANYLQSMRQEQMDNGAIPNVIPNNLGKGNSSGWGDACTVIPWEIYFRTGDKRILEDNYEMMNRWLGYYASKANGNIVSMQSFGDWLQPFSQPLESNRMGRRGDTPADFISTAYYAKSVELTMRTAAVLGKTAEAQKLQKLHNEIKKAFGNKFFDNNGRTTSKMETQTQYLLALDFDLISKENTQKAGVHLKRVIADCDNHLRTGFLGTPILPLVLDKIGETDLMYSILFKESYPSWFYSINQGATTMWERWDSYTLKDGFHKDGMNSFNHYAYGAIGRWMYERIAGIKPIAAGYKEIEIAPVLGGPLTAASASYDSPYGKINSSWKFENGNFNLEVTVPSNTTAKIVIPADTSKELLMNGSSFKNNTAIQLDLKTDKTFVLIAAAGTYRFTSKVKK
ncbi:family 78 glycoside hydrolase catalytic domain [Flavobacterium sp. NG2]|uniref:family 78 glycoside hydrolase catalytic domain n=1 Tax=Flavobacterium sp. NG2 TaxID=3097547 RepID=UPI002A80BD84|nr:family 78 glycoside hydrolase catalytic domain [Flavobacterium sp. NG2]WPR70151.1 family 78 glycoside hydrolase catalytic domain [Flavobacterium sp. NG2]